MIFLLKAYGDTQMTTPNGRAAPMGPYLGIKNQVPNQQQEANIVNQQKTKQPGETRVDLLPCRLSPKMPSPIIWKRGDEIEFQNQWNNPHASFCELNMVKPQGNQTKVFQVLPLTPCGSGFTRQGLKFKIPENFPKCEDGCFLQYYAYSLEPRDYATCVDFVIKDDPPSGSTLSLADFKFYSDKDDFEKVSNDYNPYRGQSPSVPFIIQAIWNLTEMGEVGDRAVELGILSDSEASGKKALKGIIKGMIQSIENSLRPSLIQDKDRLSINANGVDMGSKTSTVNIDGYNSPISQDAYGPNLQYDHINSLNGNGGSFSILSKPSEREFQTTYIPIPDVCMKFAIEAAEQLKTSSVGSNLSLVGDRCAEELNLTDLNRKFYEAIALLEKKRRLGTGIMNPSDQFNIMLYSKADRVSLELLMLILITVN
eukprot:NODE_1201_length_1809_cov_0.884211.p1 type:complete len:426 gc:universal NODE_1201_length_1809_cov_0.884211:1378-101(-)